MPSDRVKFENKHGCELSARIDWPLSKGPYPFAIFAHVFTGNKNIKSARHISRALAQNGIAVLRFDFTGLGESQGNFADTNFSSTVDDLISAAEYLTEHYESPSLMIGHSLGGAASLFAGSKIDSVQAIVTIGSPSYPEHVAHLIQDSVEDIEKNGEAKVNIGGREFLIKKQFLDDLKAQNHIDIIKNLGKAILVMHSPQDRIVEIDNAAHIYQLAKHPKSFVTLDGADHMLTSKDDAFYAGQVISSWVKRYVEFPQREKLTTDQQVVVRLNEEDKYTTDVQAGRHGFVTDEPEEFDGNGFGPSPYDLLIASLGTCTAMTLHMYARRKGWDLVDVKVHLNHSKTSFYHDDMKELDEKKSKIDRFERVIEIKGNLTDEQKAALLRIANRCPVHRTLKTPNVFATRLKEQADWVVEKSN